LESDREDELNRFLRSVPEASIDRSNVLQLLEAFVATAMPSPAPTLFLSELYDAELRASPPVRAKRYR
jgi:hypothetical protein